MSKGIEVTRPDGSTQVVDADEARYEGDGLSIYRAGELVYGFAEWDSWRVVRP